MDEVLRCETFAGSFGYRLKEWKLEITGLVKRRMTFTLRELKARPRQEIIFTLECSGNRPEPLVHGVVGNAKWAGTPLAPLLQEAGVLDKGIEVVFVGSDVGEEEVRGIKMQQHFARSMSLQDAMDSSNLLCYEMNIVLLPLCARQGHPQKRQVPDCRRGVGRSYPAGGSADRRRTVEAGDDRPGRGDRIRVEDLVLGVGEARCRRAHHWCLGPLTPGGTLTLKLVALSRA